MNIKRLWRGLTHPRLTSRYLFGNQAHRLLKRIYAPNDGVYIMDRDWDNLIILDACRFDIFRDVVTFDGDLEAVTSRGSATPEFLKQNFDGRIAYDTVFVSSNAQVGKYRKHIDVYKLVGLWGDKVDEHSRDQTSPRNLTDAEPVVENTIHLHEQYPNKRLISHFLPPHTPYLVKDGERITESSPYRTLMAARRGEISAEEIQSVYTENVKYILEQISTLLDELSGKTVITADHGELLGEGVPWYARILHGRWGLDKWRYFDYGHYNYIHEPKLVTVPWFEITNGSRRRIEAATQPEETEVDEDSIEQQLQSLGYKT